MICFKQILLLALTQIRILLRNRKAAIFGLLLCIVYLTLGNQVLVITYGNNVKVGIFTNLLPVFKDISQTLKQAEVKPVQFYAHHKGMKALEKGEISAFISYRDTIPPCLTLALSGKNPILDNQISALLLTLTPKLSTQLSRQGNDLQFNVKNIQVAPSVMVTFMTASLLPFLILHLGLIYCGLSWIHDWEFGQFYTWMLLPTRRSIFVSGRMLGSIILIILNLFITLTVCRYFVTWQLPETFSIWILVILVQIFVATGFHFFFTSVCKKELLYLYITVMLIFLLIFISGTFAPAETMPRWKMLLAHLTPTFYAVRSMRAVMLNNSSLILKDILALTLWGVAFYICGYFYFKRSTIDKNTI